MRKALHIVETSILAGDEILVHFSDGAAAVYEAEELEKLRPAPKRIIPARSPINQPLYAL